MFVCRNVRVSVLLLSRQGGCRKQALVCGRSRPQVRREESGPLGKERDSSAHESGYLVTHESKVEKPCHSRENRIKCQLPKEKTFHYHHIKRC